MSEAPRPSRLGLGTKVSYGFGSVAQATAGAALSQSTITYFLVRVIGLHPAVVGLVVLISLSIDAVLDPVIGRLSDTLRTPWGRRHPFMYASALPIALAIFLMWRPPHQFSPEEVAAYTLILLIVLRLCVSLYQIPSDALIPELAPDYHERTSLISFRYFFAFAGGLVVFLVMQFVFLRKDASHPLGQNDPAAYASFGVFAAILTFGAILISSATTHRYIPGLWQAPVRRQTLMAAIREVLATLGNPSLISVMGAGLLAGVAGGITSTLSAFMDYYFWGLSPQLVGFIGLLVAPSSIIAVIAAPFLSRVLDKKRTMLVVFTLAIVSGVIPVVLRLVGLLPPNGSPVIPILLAGDRFFSNAFALIGYVIIGSMIADVAEDNAVKTGVRSEGLLFAASNLLPKFTAGIGGMLGAVILEVVRFPTGAQTSHLDFVDPAIMRNMALLWLPAALLLNLGAVSMLLFYRLDRSSHEANLESLSHTGAFIEPPADVFT
ncbi:MAG TPA: MFS transporter [Caulobacteraceae bacterium]|nr:MFS transporter [Caulobacteraceae bacterium]